MAAPAMLQRCVTAVQGAVRPVLSHCMPVWLLAIAHACLPAALACLGLQPASLNGYSQTHSEREINCAGSFVEARQQNTHAAASVHVCRPVKTLPCAACLQGCLVPYRPLAAVFVYSSKIPSMRCVTSRCVALDGCYSAGQQSARPLDEPRARATRAMIV